ncbi:hypothetical protein SAMN06295974_3744 [Plantibacter flavus]|uniref:Uncharacterized protein n=1 Tax=Plantibacter flavus TaxID=150123 RepID=A0A3N2BLN0_9MICO|nr:hypothetical protein [Plantibacter flavus]ROR76108.1 hypothetical protein EDD42_4061 [Plantibacter flavus]SMG48510.1 hypothetical protein SAMN06295974_3744 [Plantibacter flavus]
MFKTLFEDPAEEVARLAAAPVGSTNHALSQLPVNILGPIQDLMIQLPDLGDDLPSFRAMVVVPYESYSHSRGEDRVFPVKRHNSSWTCIVVASSHPSYPVGGHRIIVPEAQLVRGTVRTFDVGSTLRLTDAS